MRTKPAAVLPGCLSRIAPTSNASTRRSTEERSPVTLDGVGYEIAPRVYRRSGTGPVPVVINHGAPPDRHELPSLRLGFVRAATRLVDRGFMVVAAPRPGFGSFSRPDRAHRTAAAYSGFDGPVTFVDLSPFGANGHQTFAKADPAAWAAPVAAFPGIVTAMTR